MREAGKRGMIWAGKFMKWIKLRNPLKAEPIHECDGKFFISASKENPVLGTVTHMDTKRLGETMSVCTDSFRILRRISAGNSVGNG